MIVSRSRDASLTVAPADAVPGVRPWIRGTTQTADCCSCAERHPHAKGLAALVPMSAKAWLTSRWIASSARMASSTSRIVASGLRRQYETAMAGAGVVAHSPSVPSSICLMHDVYVLTASANGACARSAAAAAGRSARHV
jgi:hypothetical protein